MAAQQFGIAANGKAVQHVFGYGMGAVKRVDPFQPGHLFDPRGRRAHGLLIPEDDVADEIIGRE